MSEEWREVPKAEMEAFVAAYPAPLDVDITGICDPPMKSWNDFSKGLVWPESMVAKAHLYSNDPEYYGRSEDRCFIREPIP